MIKSMTGFSSVTFSLDSTQSDSDKQLQITMTLKSLNSRFFEANCKLPYALNHLEIDIIKIFKNKLYRGAIYFTVHMTNHHALSSHLEPDLTTAGNYIKAIETIKNTFHIAGSVSVSDIITLPNVFANKEEPLNPDILAVFMQNISTLVAMLCKVRIKEGEVLAQDIHQRIKVIKHYLGELEPRAHIVMEQRKALLFQTLKNDEINQNPEVTLETQNLLIYNNLDKIDIHEEIVRFKTHLDSLSAILSSTEHEQGKKLDFTLQELFREINTITSKCSDALISALAINIKVELEKAREQTQNIV